MLRNLRSLLIPAALFLSISNLVFAEEITITIAETPQAVIKAVKAKYPTAEIVKVDKDEFGGMIHKYEVKIRVPGGKMHEVDVTPGGQIVNDRQWDER